MNFVRVYVWFTYLSNLQNSWFTVEQQKPKTEPRNHQEPRLLFVAHEILKTALETLTMAPKNP